MFKRKQTQGFMDMWFSPEDHQSTMRVARNLDTAGLERKRKELQLKYNQRILAEKAQKVADAAAKAAKIWDQLDDHVNLLTASSEQNTCSSAPQMAEGFVREHYHGDDEDFGECEDDVTPF
ncbi:hypothetical protein B0H14DRAFT_3433496 [Mycena olivaceomarginata]|nr:hypothetical protein B0H14DRAFT_3433496 [Mycena olivaceomarginata]